MSDTKIKVSIIIPTYNVEAYIIACLESVASQTYQGKIECLIVDDCGTDNSIAKARTFIHTYRGNIEFKILHHTQNRGLSASRNTGVAAAAGDYVYFLDSDDTILPETIEEMANVVMDYPQADMVQGGMASMDDVIIEDFTQRNLPSYTDDVNWIIENMLFHLPVSSCNRLLRTDFLRAEGIKFHEGIIHEDVAYSYQLALKCRRIGFVRKNTYLYRHQRQGSITNTPQEKHALQSRILVINDCIDAYLGRCFDTREMQSMALNALWKKWMFYMMVHRGKTLSCYATDIMKTSKRLSSVTPFPQKMGARLYQLLPITLKGNRWIIKFFSAFVLC